MYKAGDPGTLHIYIRAVDGDGKPTGDNLATGSRESTDVTTDSGGAWYYWDLGAGAPLTNGVQYSILIHADATDYAWRYDTGLAGINGYWQTLTTFNKYTSDAEMFETYSGSGATTQTITETSRARIKLIGITDKITSTGRIKQLGITKTITEKGRIKLVDTTKKLTEKARIKAIRDKLLSSQALIVDVGKIYLYLPPSGSSAPSPATFQWYIPSNRWAKNLHFQLQIDKTDDTFGDLEVEKFSYKDSGFQYFNGASWVSLPTDGVDNSYAGNLARFSTILTGGLKFWKIRAFAG
jgi:hypothetical protein